MRTFFVLLCVAGCRASAPPVEVTCTTDDECGSSGLDDKCCDKCEPTAGTKKWAESKADWCNGKTGGPPRCPSLDCPRVTDLPKCVAGKCVVAPPIPVQ